MTRKNGRRKGATRKQRYKTGGAEDSDPDDIKLDKSLWTTGAIVVVVCVGAIIASKFKFLGLDS